MSNVIDHPRKYWQLTRPEQPDLMGTADAEIKHAARMRASLSDFYREAVQLRPSATSDFLFWRALVFFLAELKYANAPIQRIKIDAVITAIKNLIAP